MSIEKDGGALPPHKNGRLLALPTWQRHLLAVCICTVTALLATPMAGRLDPANIVMLFLLAVLAVAVSLGLEPALLAAFLSVGLFDFLFVPPRFSFEVNDGQYVVTFAVMLAVAIVTGRLTAGLRRRADESATEALRTGALYEMARDLSGALMVEQIAEITGSYLHRVLNAEAVLLLPDGKGNLKAVEVAGTKGLAVEPTLAFVAYEKGEPVECSPLAAPGFATLYLPLRAPMRVRGVLAVAPADGSRRPLPDEHGRLQAAASLAAIAIERVHYVDVAQRTQVQMVSERLRSSILSALSHDLRTPLTVLVGLADSLAMSRPQLPDDERETAGAIRDQAERLNGLVANLLDMARLHAGDVTLQKEWQPIEEVIGSSIKLLGRALAEHPVKVSLASDFPLVEFDAILIERVLCNLLENAAKYSPPGTPIEIVVRAQAGNAEVSVSDSGDGFAGDTVALFEMFARGEHESAKPGVGLGLAICRAIVEAHGGTISAANRPQGGGSVTFTLPLGEPPTIEEEPIPGEMDASHG